MSIKWVITGVLGSMLLVSGQVMADQARHSAQSQTAKHKPVVTQSPRGHGKNRLDVSEELQKQAMLINRGVKHGELTAFETRQLRNEQQRIKVSYQRMRRNGLDRQEISQLDRMLDQAERHIYKESNDGQRVRMAETPDSHYAKRS